jgi:predicted RNase H-like nuclease (RuvC/YqgF family)
MPELTPDTEVLRIEGNVTVPKIVGTSGLYLLLTKLLTEEEYNHIISVVPQDSETGMVLIAKKDIEAYRGLIKQLEKEIEQLQKTDADNDINLLTLSEELAHVKAGREGYKQAYERSEMELLKYRVKEAESYEQSKQNVSALKERVGEPWLKKFIKWCKGL